MDGPGILARSLTNAAVEDKVFGNYWQYHSRSDSHSKIACWTLLFDLLQNCPLLARHVSENKVGFGINHQMYDFRTGRKKDLDLVICTPGPERKGAPETFASRVQPYQVDLTPRQKDTLAKLPELTRLDVGSVHIAIEAKACMTEHVKALPRLYDELNSSHLAIHGSADFAIAAGLAMVNISEDFVSPGRNKHRVTADSVAITKHKQPSATVRTIEKLREIPRRTQQGDQGFDALGIVVVRMRNDGSPVTILTEPPAPDPHDWFFYDQMVRRIASLYASKFGHI